MQLSANEAQDVLDNTNALKINPPTYFQIIPYKDKEIISMLLLVILASSPTTVAIALITTQRNLLVLKPPSFWFLNKQSQQRQGIA